MTTSNSALMEDQLRLEEESLALTVSLHTSETIKRTKSAGGDTKEAIALERLLVPQLVPKLEEFRRAPMRGARFKRRALLDAFVSNEQIAYITIRAVFNVLLQQKGHIALTYLSQKVVRELFDVRAALVLQQKAPCLDAALERSLKLTRGRLKHAKIRASYKTLQTPKLAIAEYIGLGVDLIDCIMKAGLDFIQLYTEKQSKCVRFTDGFLAILHRLRDRSIKLSTRYKPLVVPPKAWRGLSGSGGYQTFSGISFVKLKSKQAKRAIFNLNANIDRLLDVVNNISKTAWRINTKVLDVVETIIGQNILSPSCSKESPVLLGKLPYMQVLPLPEVGHIEDVRLRAKMISAVGLKNQQIASQRLAFLLALSVARDYRSKEFFFSYQLDFRGRLYPLQKWLTPQSAGNSKALLQFSQGCPIANEEELFWFKVSGANLAGFDKLEYSERIKQICDEDIKEIARDPIGNARLWHQADEPLLYLAWCFEYAEYLNNPKEFISYLPVQLDATCSGIQIYSGLLRDKEGAEAVNVIGEKRSDIYQLVANKVNEFIANNDYPSAISYEKADGNSYTASTAVELASLKGKITRRLTKRNTMTQPYSVTKRGMFEQVREELEDIVAEGAQFWRGELWVVTKIIADLNDRAITDIVKGAKIGQAFLKEVVKTVNESPCLWFTPIFNFPVYQGVPKTRKKQVRTPFGSLVIYEDTAKLNKLKQLSGIAPNYIHSLDATLLYRTVELCWEQGVKSFMLIHDSFGVPLKDVSTLNTSLRRAYIEIFSSNPLAAWCKDVGVELPDGVMINTLDLSDVENSKYIIS